MGCRDSHAGCDGQREREREREREGFPCATGNDRICQGYISISPRGSSNHPETLHAGCKRGFANHRARDNPSLNANPSPMHDPRLGLRPRSGESKILTDP